MGETMLRSLQSDPFAHIRDDARSLVERASDHEDHLEALVAEAEAVLEEAELQLSQMLDRTASSIEELRNLLRLQLHRSVDGAHWARRLLVDAREQRVAAAQLLSAVDRDRSFGEQGIDGSIDPNAVLVVDDYHDIREVVAQFLESDGFVVRTAANGLEALIAALEMRPAVIVMDISMPVLNGFEATRLIKATDATSHARVIAYTANPVSEVFVNKLFAAVLQKPAPPDVVVATVRQLAGLSN